MSATPVADWSCRRRQRLLNWPKPLRFANAAVRQWPFPQKRPGAAADGRDCKQGAGTDSNEHSNSSCGVSPETPLEDVPRRPIAIQRWTFPLVSGRMARNPHFCRLGVRPGTGRTL